MKNPRLARRMGWVAALLVLVALIALGVYFGMPTVRVEVAAVTRGSWQRVLEEDGRARARERYVISSPLGGVLERVALHAGDCVAQNDVVATVHAGPSPLLDARSRGELEARGRAADASVAVARSALERAEAARSHAEEEAVRARSLLERGAIPSRDVEHAELELSVARRERDAARFSINVAQHEREMIRALLHDTSSEDAGSFALRAPVDGCVLRVLQEDEGAVAPGAPIMEIADPAAVEVVVDLLSTDAILVQAADEATLLGFGVGGSIPGRVRVVEPTATVRLSALGVEERRVDVVVDPLERTDAWERVGDGYRVDVQIVVERLEDTLLVPTSALFRDGDGWAALVLDAGRARRRPVEVLRYGPLQSAIGADLEEGMFVIIEPPEELLDGDRVEIRSSL